MTPVDEYAALIYAGSWGIHGASLPGRATFAPGNVGFATFGAPRPMEVCAVFLHTTENLFYFNHHHLALMAACLCHADSSCQ